jgi:hypothetical protein
MTNCCDDYGNCNQGRDCPIRKERIERVAKVGQKMHGPEPIRGAGWRHHLKRFAYWLLTGLVGIAVWTLLLYLVVWL